MAWAICSYHYPHCRIFSCTFYYPLSLQIAKLLYKKNFTFNAILHTRYTSRDFLWYPDWNQNKNTAAGRPRAFKANSKLMYSRLSIQSLLYHICTTFADWDQQQLYSFYSCCFHLRIYTNCLVLLCSSYHTIDRRTGVVTRFWSGWKHNSGINKQCNCYCNLFPNPSSVKHMCVLSN